MSNNQKIIEFYGNKYCYTSVKEYLSLNKRRGTSFTNKQFNLKFHMVKNCFSLGKNAQLILPIENSKGTYTIFEESFAYNHGYNIRKEFLHNTLAAEQSSFIEIGEACPLYHLWSDNFYHWILECLPKVLILEDQGYTGKYIVFNVKFIVDSLKLFGIDEERICYSDQNYIVKNMIISPTYSGYDLVNNTALVKYLRDKLLDSIGILQGGGKRVYIKRTARRTVLNEDEIIDILKKYDFEIIVPEDYSVRDQFRLMTNVDFSVTAHGANSTLILAQKYNSVYAEFFSSAYVMYHCAGIVKALGLDYIPIVEHRDRPIVLKKNETGIYCNITVPTSIFEILIANAVKRITKKLN